MKRRLATLVPPIGCASVFLTLFWACVSDPPAPMPGESHSTGALLYEQHCAACHGDAGGGDGSMAPYLRVWPRDFRRERFNFVSVETGTAPADEDLVEFIRRGSRTTHMPGHPQLSDSQVREVASYLREIRRLGIVEEITAGLIEEDEDFTAAEVEEIAFERVAPGTRMAVPERPRGYTADTTRGAELFARLCASCHGPAGAGDGSEELFDDLGRPIEARDLTVGEYRGGGGDRDLYWRLRSGIPGTAMPAFGSGQMSDEETWQMIDYLRALAGGKRKGG